ncbi:hypothetical protein CJU90_3577 [Yarrowia sp. C11]|nr:hypothetical protein CJU90_3577 [Yarrowia sp. C11]
MPEHNLTTLPAELVKIIAGHLDIDSLCALSHTNKAWSSIIPDNQFRAKLQAECPWFEPRFSLRSTWKECAIEYCRRHQSGSRVSGPIRKIDADEWDGDRTIDTRPEFDPVYAEDEIEPTFDNVQRIEDTLKLDEDKIFKSQYGIQLDLSEYTGPRNHTSLHQIVSYPHVLVFVFRLELTDHYHVVVKYNDSEGVTADIKRMLTQTGVYCHVRGEHVFLGLLHHYGADHVAEIMYVNTGDIVFREKGWLSLQFTCNDGLFFFIVENENLVVSASLKKRPRREKYRLENYFMFPLYLSEAHGRPFYAVICDRNTAFMVDDVRRVMVYAVEDKRRVQVISDREKRRLDKVNKVSRPPAMTLDEMMRRTEELFRIIN